MNTVSERLYSFTCGETMFIVQPRLQEWFSSAKAGDWVIYATGDVGRDRRNASDPQGLLNASANYAAKMARGDYVQLTQRKLGDNLYQYRMRKK